MLSILRETPGAEKASLHHSKNPKNLRKITSGMKLTIWGVGVLDLGFGVSVFPTGPGIQTVHTLAAKDPVGNYIAYEC